MPSSVFRTVVSLRPIHKLLSRRQSDMSQYSTLARTVPMGNPAMTSDIAGGSQPHENFMPYLCINYIISLFGIFPSQPESRFL